MTGQLQSVADLAEEKKDTMRSEFLLQITRSCAAATALLMLAGPSMSYGMNPKHARHESNRNYRHVSVLFIVPEKKQTEAPYQPPRSPGFNEDFGG
jgi:hypothetical protein